MWIRLPVVKPYEPVPYNAFDLADPFGPAKILLTQKGWGQGGGGVKPDLARPKEPLEMYPLETLKMVGTLERRKQTFALIKADAGLHRVRAGNYLGQNFGVITKITGCRDHAARVGARRARAIGRSAIARCCCRKRKPRS